MCRIDVIVPGQASDESPDVPRPPPLASDEANRVPPVPPPLPGSATDNEEASPGPAAPPIPDDHRLLAPRKSSLRRPVWLSRGPKFLPPHAYRLDQGKLQSVKWLALILATVVLFSALPALAHTNLESAPGWACAALLLAALQTVYLGWMVVTPDWSSIRVVMLVFAFTATLYAATTVIVIVTPPDEPMALGLDEVRASAPRWGGAVLLVNALAAYLCGRTSAKWCRLCELEIAAVRRARRVG